MLKTSQSLPHEAGEDKPDSDEYDLDDLKQLNHLKPFERAQAQSLFLFLLDRDRDSREDEEENDFLLTRDVYLDLDRRFGMSRGEVKQALRALCSARLARVNPCYGTGGILVEAILPEAIFDGGQQ